MNAKQIATIASLVFATGSALAIEAEQYEPPASTLTRTEVKAELDRAKVEPTMLSGGEATVFIDRPVAAARDRDEVRHEARVAAHAHSFNELYVGA